MFDELVETKIPGDGKVTVKRYITDEETFAEMDMQGASDAFVAAERKFEKIDRRAKAQVDVTKHPTSGWVIQQLREAFPFEPAQKYLIFDRDQKFGFEVIAAVKATRINPKRTSFRSPWQNGIAERWVGGKL
jgi:hypothetical protein